MARHNYLETLLVAAETVLISFITYFVLIFVGDSLSMAADQSEVCIVLSMILVILFGLLLLAFMFYFQHKYFQKTGKRR